MQVHLGGVVSSEPLEIHRPCGSRAAPDSPATGGRRRGSGGSRTLLDDNEEGMTSKNGDHEHSDDDNTQESVARPLSPPLTPTAMSPSGGAEDGQPRRNRANTGTTTQSGGIRKYPSLALTAALHALFPNLDSDITRAFHLQRAWESE